MIYKKNELINYTIGMLLICVVFILFPDYPFPLAKENIKESIGQGIVALSGLFIILNELNKQKHKVDNFTKKTSEKVENERKE